MHGCRRLCCGGSLANALRQRLFYAWGGAGATAIPGITGSSGRSGGGSGMEARDGGECAAGHRQHDFGSAAANLRHASSEADLQSVLARNQEWAAAHVAADPEYFKRLVGGAGGVTVTPAALLAVCCATPVESCHPRMRWVPRCRSIFKPPTGCGSGVLTAACRWVCACVCAHIH